MRRRSVTAVLVLVSIFGVFMIGRLSAENGSSRNANPHVAFNRFSHFTPLSASFATTDYGWALGTATCHLGRECLVLQATVDGGYAWTPVVLPASLIKAAGRTVHDSIAALLSQADGTGLRVYFANRQDGWIYGTLPYLTQPGNVYGVTNQEALAHLEPGVIFVGGQGPSGRFLLGSFDGGRHWQRIYVGQALSLNFTSAAQGNSVIQDTRGNSSLIMTFDGGRNWERVHF